MKSWKLYILNAFLIFLVGYEILPNFSLNKNEFVEVSGLLHFAQLETDNNERNKKLLFNNLSSERVIISLANRLYEEYYITDIYKKYWHEILDPNVLGEEVTLYLSIDRKNEDPFRLEIDGQVIYDTNVRFERNLMIIVFTLIFTIYNLYNFFDPDISSSLLVIKEKVEHIKHYFLNQKNAKR